MKAKVITNNLSPSVKAKIFLAILMAFAARPIKAAEAVKPNAQQEDAVVHHTIIEPIGGGFNPEYFGYRVSGSIIKGTNECYASAASSMLTTHVEGNVLYITPVIQRMASLTDFCPSHYDPEWDHLTLDVRYSRKEIHKIVIQNHNVTGGTHTIIP